MAAVYKQIRELRHEMYNLQASSDLLVELDRTEEQLQNSHSSVNQTQIKLQQLRNEFVESEKRSSEIGGLGILKVAQQNTSSTTDTLGQNNNNWTKPYIALGLFAVIFLVTVFSVGVTLFASD